MFFKRRSPPVLGSLEGIERALIRIANALEGHSVTGFRTNYSDFSRDESWVGAVDDAAVVADENRRDNYRSLTGVSLDPFEESPEVISIPPPGGEVAEEEEGPA
jgi:hypothetical protein